MRRTAERRGGNRQEKIRIAAFLAFLVFPLSVGSAQQQLRSPVERVRELISRLDNVAFGDVPAKCGTPLTFDVRRRWNDFPLALRSEIKEVLQRPLTDTYRISPSGRFRIHYDTTGTDQPAMLTMVTDGAPIPGTGEQYVDSVIAIFEDVWVQEIDVYGFQAPPTDAGAGGGPQYDVYLQNFSDGSTFGLTEFESEIQPQGDLRKLYTSFIVLENDFAGYRKAGMDGLRVTAAHEFHHAIQIGSYGVWTTVPNSDFYFYEISSVLFEELLFDEVNDYRFDLPRFFQAFRVGNVSLSMTYYPSSFADPFYPGYERSVWAFYLVEKFGAAIIREVWEGMRTRPVLRSMEEVLRRYNSSLAEALAEFNAWNYFTSDRADTLRYYSEGNTFPRFAPNLAASYNGFSSILKGESTPFSCQHLNFGIGGDTITSVVTNQESESAYRDNLARNAYALTLSGSRPPGGVQILSNGLSMGFQTSNYENWRVLHLGFASRSDMKTQIQPFPNPIRLSRSDALYLPVTDATATEAEVFFLSSSFDLALSGRYPVKDLFGTKMVSVPVGDLNTRISSGVHFVVLKTAAQEFRWKVAIVR